MRYVIKDKDTGKLLIDSKLEGYAVSFSQVNGINEVWIYATKEKEGQS